MDSRTVSASSPNRLRSFDPVRIARLEYHAWVGYQPASPLLPLERASLVRAYAALLAAVHH